MTVDKTGNVAKISSFPKNLEIEDMDMRNHMMYAAVNMNHKVFIYSMLKLLMACTSSMINLTNCV